MDYLTIGLARIIFRVTEHQLVTCSAVYGLVAFVPLFIIMAVMDNKRHIIRDEVCAITYGALIVHSVVFVGIVGVAICVLCTYLTFRKREFQYFGQADFLIVAHYLTANTFMTEGLKYAVVQGVLWLLVLLLYLGLYRDRETGRTYIEAKRRHEKFFIPCLVSYGIATGLFAVLRAFLLFYPSDYFV